MTDTERSPLWQYHNKTVTAAKINEDNPDFDGVAAHLFDGLADTAIDLLAAAGYEYLEPDAFGTPIDEDVQGLIHLALFRAPKLAALIDTLLESHNQS